MRTTTRHTENERGRKRKRFVFTSLVVTLFQVGNGGYDSEAFVFLQVKLVGKGDLGELRLECSKWKRDPWASFEKKKSDWAWHDWSFAGAMDSKLWMLWTLWTLWTFCGWGWDHRLDKVMSGTCPHNNPRHDQVTSPQPQLSPSRSGVPLSCPDTLG